MLTKCRGGTFQVKKNFSKGQVKIMNIFKWKRRRSSNLRNTQSRWRFGTKSAKNFQERVINVGQRPLNFEESVSDDTLNEAQIEFVDNTIKSSKYTLLTFLPK